MSSQIIEITRKSLNNQWNNLKYCVFDKNVIKRPIAEGFVNYELKNEYSAIDHLLQHLIVCNPTLKPLTLPMQEGFKQLLNESLEIGNNKERSIKIPVFSHEETHLSCRKSNKVNKTSKLDKSISQRDLKNKLGKISLSRKVEKFFTDNSCSVCASTFRDILDDSLHIVVSSCKHVICCKCADVILSNGNPVCPQCRRKLSPESFELMMFNNKLEQDFGNQKVFL